MSALHAAGRRFELAGLLAILTVMGLTGFTIYADVMSGHVNPTNRGAGTISASVYLVCVGTVLLIVQRLSVYEAVLIEAINLLAGLAVYWDLMKTKPSDDDTQGLATILALIAALVMTSSVLLVTRLLGTPYVQGEWSIRTIIDGLRDND